MKIRSAFLVCLLTTAAATAFAAPATYKIDASHTYPSFEADHMGGLSTWRGKINSTSGTVTFDRDTGAGTVDVKMDMSSIDFGNDKLNEHAKSPDIFDVARFPTATFKGKLSGFEDGKPTEVDGTLVMHGVSKPVTLKINSFMCKPNPMSKKETCGADASATINREDFGVSYGKAYGFHQEVKLQIQIEAVRED